MFIQQNHLHHHDNYSNNEDNNKMACNNGNVNKYNYCFILVAYGH